jgi:hypothetical protein
MFWWGSVRPDIVTIALGMNDQGSISTASYVANITTMVARLRLLNPNVHIILCTPSPTIDLAKASYTSAFVTALLTLGYDGDSGASGSANLSNSTSRVDIARWDTAWTTSNADLKANMFAINIQSITATSTLMTVNATAHGLSNGVQISIRGASQSTYNVTYSSSGNTPVVSGASTNTFTIAGTGFSTAGDSTSGMFGITDVIHPYVPGHVLLANKITALIGVSSNAYDPWITKLGTIV